MGRSPPGSMNIIAAALPLLGESCDALLVASPLLQAGGGPGPTPGHSGVTSGDGASAEVAVLGEDSEDSGEEAVQEPADGPVGVQTVVAETVAPSKSTTRREQARMARQRRLEATVAEYRRLVALEEEEDTQSSGATTTSSTGTAASSSVTKPAGPSRANKDNRHRQATEIPAAPHRSCKERQRRLRVRMSNLEQEVLKYKNLVKGLRSELATLRKEYDAHAAKCTSTSTLQ
ncbi:uncharacterized protein LOC144756459 [Lissotriton helveticus]